MFLVLPTEISNFFQKVESFFYYKSLNLGYIQKEKIMTETTMNEKAQMGRQSNRTHLQQIRVPSGSLFDNPDKVALEQTVSEIHELGLESNLAELEVQGYTTIKEAIPSDQLKRAKETIIRIKEDITGKKVNLDSEPRSRQASR